MTSEHSIIGLGLAFLFAGSAQRTFAQPSASACATTSTGKQICVRFDNLPTAPQSDFDFTFDLTSDPNQPRVELVRGRSTQGILYEWRIWCKDSSNNPANIGEIRAITDYDFDVKVLDADGNDGAASVGPINLHPSGNDKYSNFGAGKIAGNLGGLFLQQAQGGTGGALTDNFVVEGDLVGDVTIPTIDGGDSNKGLHVTGNVAEGVAIAVTDKLRNGGMLTNGGAVPATVIVSINDMEDNSVVSLAEQEGGCSAELVMANGIPATTSLSVGELYRPGYLDLNNHNVDGFLSLNFGGDGDVLNGGVVTGSAYLTYSCWPYSGAAEFAGVAGTSQDEAILTACILDGTIRITGDVSANATVSVSGSFPAAGSIVVDGDVVGHISVPSLAGDILVAGLLSGGIKVSDETTQGSLIRVTEGITSTGEIVVNESAGNHNCNGNIHVGPITGVAPITFDGSIRIKAGASGGGDLIGEITVRGCHATNDDLEFYICGGDGCRNINIIQQTCQTRVKASCVTQCGP